MIVCQLHDKKVPGEPITLENFVIDMINNKITKIYEKRFKPMMSGQLAVMVTRSLSYKESGVF